MNRFQDINLNNLQIKNEYYNRFVNKNINEAHKIIINNTELKNKSICAENLNDLILQIIKLEKNYNIDVIDVLKQKNNIYQISINDLLYLKEFQSNKQYQVNNFVLYNQEVYLCKKKPTIGVIPTNTNYWVYLGLKGDIGAKSLGIKYKGNWSGLSNYHKYDMVVYQNNLYVSKTTNQSKQPKENPIDWSWVMGISSSSIIIQKETPKLNNKEIWFQIL